MTEDRATCDYNNCDNKASHMIRYRQLGPFPICAEHVRPWMPDVDRGWAELLPLRTQQPTITPEGER